VDVKGKAEKKGEIKLGKGRKKLVCKKIKDRRTSDISGLVRASERRVEVGNSYLEK